VIYTFEYCYYISLHTRIRCSASTVNHLIYYSIFLSISFLHLWLSIFHHHPYTSNLFQSCNLSKQLLIPSYYQNPLQSPRYFYLFELDIPKYELQSLMQIHGDVCLLHLSVLIRHYSIPFDLYGI
jgi:hypothetical protein